MQIAKFCIAILFIANSLCMNAMQQKYTITDMPKEVIRQITDFLAEITLDENDDNNALAAKKRNLCSFASSCRYLHESVTRENKTITIKCPEQRRQRGKNTRSVSVFLAQVFLCIQHIIAREGNNPICLLLECNGLAEDTEAVSSFLSKCSQKPIVQYIAYLHLGSNKFAALPKGIDGLTELKRLWLNGNQLRKVDLYRLEEIINNSLHKLEDVNLIFNDINLRDVYKTIARCKLRVLSVALPRAYYNFEGRNDEEPTAEEKAACKVETVSLF